MKIILFIFSFLIILISNVYADKCYDSDTTPVILDSDKKPGRFFEDQPDVTNDFQVHIVYTLLKDSKDKEGDINGKLEKWIETADKWILKTTAKANKKSNFNNGEGQKLKWDRRKDGKLDITFLRLNRTKKDMKKSKWGSCGNVFGRSIVNNGMNNPKKIYFNFGDYTHKDWPFSGGFPIFSVFSKHQKKWPLNNKEVGYFILHEVLHAMGGIFTCSPNFFEGHNTKNNKSSGDMMSRHVGEGGRKLDPKNDDYWGHKNKTCPDMQDSVYFTPTSDTPFDPFEVTCLPKDKWKFTKHDYQNIEDRRGEGEQCFYARGDVNVPWKNELGIFKRN